MLQGRHNSKSAHTHTLSDTENRPASPVGEVGWEQKLGINTHITTTFSNLCKPLVENMKEYIYPDTVTAVHQKITHRKSTVSKSFSKKETG